MNEFFNSIQKLDFLILEFIRGHFTNSFLDKIMPFITHLGSAGLIWIILCIVLLITKKYKRTGIAVAISLLLSLLVCNIILKPLVARIRPYDINTLIEVIVKKPTDFSFPSGHSSASFATAVVLLLFRHRFLGTAAVILAALIAFSRLYLYVHFPSDVISGIILGTVLAFPAHYIGEILFKKINI